MPAPRDLGMEAAAGTAAATAPHLTLHPHPAPAAATSPQEAPTTGVRAAYITLFTNDSYLPGVQCLYRSVQAVGGRYPFIVLYTPGVSEGAVASLEKEGCIMQLAKRFEPQGVDHSEYKRDLYLECWCKLRMWEMEQYDRLVYLDADMVVYRNIDHLFSLPPGFYAVGDCYGGRETAEERDSCCHHTPHLPPFYFNAGFYVMAPSRKELTEMEAALAEGRIPVRFFAEQDFLNGFFQGRVKWLPYTYNAQKRIKIHHPSLWCLDDIHVIHYVDEKPWSHRYAPENAEYREEVELWWAMYEGRTADVAAIRKGSVPSTPNTPAGFDAEAAHHHPHLHSAQQVHDVAKAQAAATAAAAALPSAASLGAGHTLNDLLDESGRANDTAGLVV